MTLLVVAAWSAKEWLGISDVAILAILVYIVYLAASFDNFRLQDRLDDIKADFEYYRQESEEQFACLDRRLKVIYEDIDTMHPDGENRHLKRAGLESLIDLIDKDANEP